MQLETAYYCSQCEQWSKNENCQKCGSKLEAKQLPIRRDQLYFIDGINEPLASVTAVTEILFKPWLVLWAAREGARAIIHDPFRSIEDAMKEVEKIKENAGLIGSTVHKIIENPPEKLEEIPKECLPYFKAFKKFESDFVEKTILKEFTVYSKKYKYAGTLDRVIEMKNKKLALIDFKTNHIVDQKILTLQLSAYKQALSEIKPELKISRIFGVQLKNDGSYSIIETEDEFPIFRTLLIIFKWLKEDYVQSKNKNPNQGTSK